MKKNLNPELVRQKIRDHVQYVILRDPVGYEEIGIGPTEIDVLPESEEEIAEFKNALKETESVMNADAALGGCPSQDPHVVFLAQDCFGFDGQVRILIYSQNPFASNASA